MRSIYEEKIAFIENKYEFKKENGILNCYLSSYFVLWNKERRPGSSLHEKSHLMIKTKDIRLDIFPNITIAEVPTTDEPCLYDGKLE
jgi:hypothetical protein